MRFWPKPEGLERDLVQKERGLSVNGQSKESPIVIGQSEIGQKKIWSQKRKAQVSKAKVRLAKVSKIDGPKCPGPKNI